MKNCITNFVMKQSWIMIMLILITKIVYSASFPIFRADRFRSGKVDEIAVISSSQPSSIWVKEIQGQIFSSPVVKDGVVYFGGRDTSIWALNAYNGEVIWQYSTSGFVDSPPLIHKNFIYLLSTDGKLYCFRLNFSSEDNETPLWTFDTASKSYGSLLLTDNDEIIFVSGPLINGLPYGYVYIVNAQTGQLIQKVSLDSFSYSSVSYYKDNLYFTTNNGTVVSYSLQQKKINWSYQVSSCLSGTTVVPYENKLYFYAGDIESKIFVLDENGVLNSSSTRLSLYATDNTQIAVSSSIIVVNVYPTSLWIKSGIKYSSQTIYAIDRNSLEVKWRRDFLVKSTPEHSYGVTSAPTIANSVIYVGLNNGEFYALDLYTGETLYSFNTGVPIIGSPAVSNGWIYFATVEGKVYGIKSNNFASIVSPDDNEIVINSTTIKILCSNIGSTYEIRCKNYTEEILVSSGNISGEQTLVGFDTKPLLDGKYKLTLSLPAGIVSNNIAIDNSPLPPTNFSALQIETNKILLSWTKSIDDGSGNNDVLFYNIYRSTDNKKFFVVAKVVSGNTYYIDIVDMLGTTYYYKITAEDKNSSSLASSVQKVFVPLITKPQPPTNVNVAIFQHYISSADVILSWSASVDESTNVAKYKVFKSTRPDMFNLVFEIIKTGNTNYYFIDRCIANNTYFYIVISENSYGKTSDTSTVVSIFIPAIMPPQPPRNLTAFDTPEDLGGNITLCWQPSVDENSVVSPVIEYRIYKSSDGNNFVVFYRYNNLGKTSYTFYDTECLTGVTFYYYITAVNNFGLESAHSNVVSAFSIKNTEIIDNTPPEIPSYVAAMDYPNDDGSKILILWSVSKDDGMGDNDVVKYKIYRNYSYLTYLPAGTTWFIDNTVLPNITYFYYLTVLDKNNNESGGTAIISCTALADGIPAKVENFTAEVKSHYSGVYVVLRWDKSADDTTGWNDVDMYIIYRATDNINYTTVISLPKGVTFYIDTNCEVNTKYYYKLIVKDKSGLTSPAVDVDVFTMYKILLLPGEKVVLKYKYLDEQLILLFSQLSLNQTVEVEIKTKDNFINMSNEMNITPVTSVYEIKTKPNKVKFNVPVKIQLYYNQQKLQNINEERLRLFLYDETLTKWLMLNNSKVVLNENYVEAEVYNFSCFVAGVYKYEYEKFFKEEHVYATPSPARGDEVKFKFIVYQPVKVKVYVYDISGDFVWQSEEKEFTQQDVGKLHEIKWNIKNVATGLYVFRIEGKQFGKKQNVIKKVAIIH